MVTETGTTRHDQRRPTAIEPGQCRPDGAAGERDRCRAEIVESRWYLATDRGGMTDMLDGHDRWLDQSGRQGRRSREEGRLPALLDGMRMQDETP